MVQENCPASVMEVVNYVFFVKMQFSRCKRKIW